MRSGMVGADEHYGETLNTGMVLVRSVAAYICFGNEKHLEATKKAEDFCLAIDFTPLKLAFR